MEGGATAERLEALKRNILIEAIEDVLPALASADIATATSFAVATLDDIRQGHNPDLEPSLRRAVEELGISLS